MSEHHNDSSDMRFLLGFFIGGLLGALIIIFMGTKEGKKAGKILRERGRDFLDELDGNIEKLREQGVELMARGEELKDQVIETMEEKKETMTVAVAEKLDEALAHISEIQERGRESTESLRSNLFKNLPKKE